MQLTDLGFDRWFLDQRRDDDSTDYRVARVTAVDRERYLIRNEIGEVPAEVTGKLLYSTESKLDLPCVGDWVLVQYYDADTFAIIHDLLPRKSLLRRKTAGEQVDFQIIAANIDVAFIIQSCDFDFNLRRLERYLVMTNDARINAIIILSKCDLISAEELEVRIEKIRQNQIANPIIPISNLTGFGMDNFRVILEKGKTYCLLGSSGVGKTTLLNKLIGREIFETNAVRLKDSRGRHTTARRQLIVLENGAMFIDTPGMRELGLIGTESGIEESFSDIADLARQCRFSDCTHTSEKGCAIREAVEQDKLDAGRYQSYLKLLKESEYYAMSYVEKRRKDKEFGKYIKMVMKQKGK